MTGNECGKEELEIVVERVYTWDIFPWPQIMIRSGFIYR
jgi:hypothetical protein